MRKILERSQLPYDANYIFADHNGIIINRGKDPATFIGMPIPPESLKYIEDGPDEIPLNSYAGMGYPHNNLPQVVSAGDRNLTCM